MMKIKIVLFLFLFSFTSFAQPTILTLEEYVEQVMEHHPLMYKSDLLRESAAANKRIARGGFDPKLGADWDQKRFKDTNYYALGSGKLKIPTWFGIEAELGYEQTSGEFIDNSDFLPPRGLWNTGISVPLGKGFIIDERRANLKQADILINRTEQERKLLRNEILFEAIDTYIAWQKAEQFVSIAKEGLEIAEDRFSATVSSFREGDKPAVDTLEAMISVRVREAELLKREQKLENVRIKLENYLWVDGYVPLELSEDVRAEDIVDDLYDKKVNSIQLKREEIIVNHPELLMYLYKFEQLDVDRRLAREELKPDLRVEYNPLLNLGENSLVDQFDPGDYKFGASLSYPILQRKERGKLKLIDIKVKENELNQAVKRQDINTKMKNFEFNIQQSISQREIFTEMVENYNTLLLAERRKFEIGESSVFLLNSREVKYLESQYKQVESRVQVISNRPVSYTHLTLPTILLV